ncbi:GDP-mannose 4,6-dehydratase [Terrilactibacillus sp. S3-3]|nr:GDP-mannose 4,6-dehydratase [Terrilactibacillus sp. S3-3]
MLFSYRRKKSFKFVYLRPFNHFGPGQKKGFVVSDFCSQIALIEQGLIEPIIKVGDLSTYRDFLPIDDIVAAYEQVISQDIPSGVYNICSGTPLSIRYLLQKIIDLSYVRINIVRDENLFRPAEVKSFAGDGSKFQRATGWRPRYNIDSCLLETLNWWRKEVEPHAERC